MTKNYRKVLQSAGLPVLVLIASSAAQAAGAPAADSAARCAALAQLAGAALGEPTARIVSATLNPPSEAKNVPGAPPGMGRMPGMPENCEVMGVMRERTGANNQKYAVKFRIRLPGNWNGRFLFSGSGGTAGMIGAATGNGGPGMPTSLDQGYAVVSTDTGHDNAANSDPTRQGQVAFGHDYLARLEYSEKSLDSVATSAKRIVQAYYGRAADHSYFAGCSNGGREGMVFAQRYPNQFDGILAQSPAFAVPKAAVAEAWDTQAFAALATQQGQTKNGLPDVVRAFADGDLRIIADAIAKACDGEDGLEDGMVQNPTQCTAARVRPVLASKICSGAKTDACVTKEQVDTLTKSLAGPHNSKGQALYADWPWDIGIGSSGWRMWKIGAVGMMDSINVMLGSPALSALFTTPPSTVGGGSEDGLRYQLGFNFDTDAQKIFATTPEFPRSAWDMVGAQSADLSKFRQHGGKLLVPHGSSDPIFSVNDTIQWWKQVDAANKGDAASFARVYVIPGMNHCGGGPSTDQFDALASLVSWVEKGQAPDQIEAKAGPASPWPGRTRPLCTYPAVARYKSGDINRAESFACVKP